MENSLSIAFRNYLEAVALKLKPNDRRLAIDHKAMLKYLVEEELEKLPEFKALVEETKVSFATDEKKYFLEWNAQNFFRRHGLYVTAFEGQPLQIDVALTAYKEAFQRHEMQRVYLVLLEGVEFTKDVLECGSFQIRRFSRTELARILQNDINAIFFERAATDLNELEDYWFIHISETVPISDLWSEPIINIGSEVSRRYTKFPETVERVFQQFAFYNWQSLHSKYLEDDDDDKGWSSPKISFFIEVTDHVLDSPKSLPLLPSFETEPVFHPETGEENGERQAIWIDLTEDEEEKLELLMLKTGKLLAKYPTEWTFIEIALGYFVKAFFSEGLEQLLWHITTIEALVGENKRNNTESMAKRLASILSSSEDDFRELYDFRCDLVHGKQPEKTAYRRHLREGRDLARRAILWFLHYLDFIQTEAAESGFDLPERKRLLKLVDDPGAGSSGMTFPTGFPKVQEWITP
jgi:hypothetical protein